MRDRGQSLPLAAALLQDSEQGASRKEPLVGGCWPVWRLVAMAGRVASCLGFPVPVVCVGTAPAAGFCHL